MAYCTRCGAPVGETARFCAACGAIVEAGAAAPRPAPAPSALTDSPRGPAGRNQDPILVPVLALVTLGIYYLIWSWRVARETDAFAGQPGRALTPVKIGAMVTGAALALLIPAYIAIFTGIVSGLPPDVLAGTRELTTAEATRLAEEVAPWFAVLALAWIAALVGYATLHVGNWRTWRSIEADERARGVAAPLSPGLMLAFILIPYLNIVTFWIALYRIQKSLNGMWSATTPAWEKTSP